VWVRCRATFDTTEIQHPAVVVGTDGPEPVTAFVDGQPARGIRESGYLDLPH
jgi:hypothetical protein